MLPAEFTACFRIFHIYTGCPKMYQIDDNAKDGRPGEV